MCTVLCSAMYRRLRSCVIEKWLHCLVYPTIPSPQVLFTFIGTINVITHSSMIEFQIYVSMSVHFEQLQCSTVEEAALSFLLASWL